MNNKLEKTEFPFGMVPNSLLNNSAISLKAKGLFGYMQSKPVGWSFSERLIASQCKESVDSVSSGLKELEAFGYLTRERKQSNKGFFIVYKLAFECGKPMVENPSKQNPIKENPIVQNPMRAKSTNNSNKEYSNKELSKKEEREGALEFLKVTFPSEFETLLMQHKSRINDFVKFSEMFEATVEQEGLVFELHVLRGRFKKFARNWIDNQGKFEGKIVSIAGSEQKYKSIGNGF
jgi:DNA-binding transcriptional regulator GbsR (MarR family)